MKSTKLGLYYRLAKPGIIYGNLMTTGAAFLFALHHTNHAPASVGLFAATLVGLGLSMAAGCVANNIIERDIDARMERTKDRALPLKQISIRSALVYAGVLGVVGLGILLFFTNIPALLATIFGIVVYVGLYTPAKQKTVHSTVIGAFAGAVPPVVGYVAVVSSFDTNALLLILILACWQMPHFFAISLYRLDEYRNAGLRIMPLRIGRIPTQALMVVYTILFSAAVLILGAINHLSWLYFVPMSAVTLGWVSFGVSGFWAKDPARWARKMFFHSLIVLLILSAVLAFA